MAGVLVVRFMGGPLDGQLSALDVAAIGRYIFVHTSDLRVALVESDEVPWPTAATHAYEPLGFADEQGNPIWRRASVTRQPPQE